MSGSPAVPPLVTLELRMSVQPAKPASTIDHLIEQRLLNAGLTC